MRIAVLPLPVGPVITVNLPKGKVTERSESVKRAGVVSSGLMVDESMAVDVPVDVVGDEGAAGIVDVEDMVVDGIGAVDASDCFPVFQQKEAFSKLILVLTSGGSEDRLRLDTQSGTND